MPSWLGVNASLMKVKLSCSSCYLSASFFCRIHRSLHFWVLDSFVNALPILQHGLYSNMHISLLYKMKNYTLKSIMSEFTVFINSPEKVPRSPTISTTFGSTILNYHMRPREGICMGHMIMTTW